MIRSLRATFFIFALHIWHFEPIGNAQSVSYYTRLQTPNHDYQRDHNIMITFRSPRYVETRYTQVVVSDNTIPRYRIVFM